MPHKVASTSYDDCEKSDECHCLDCKGKTRSDGSKWSKCDYDQYCAKVAEVNKQLNNDTDAISSNPVARTATAGAIREAGNVAAAAFRSAWKEVVPLGMMSRTEKKAHFYHDCAYDDSNEGRDVSTFQPDHVQELQLGGDISGPFKWLTSHVNGSIGSSLQHVDPAKHKAIVTNCCPP
jgi:hypothetical protein